MAASFLDFLHTCEALKRTRRTGWVQNGIDGPESVADHSHRVALLAFCIKDPAVNRDRCVKMGLVHDLAESIVGDITPHCGVETSDKHAQEKAAFETLVAGVRAHNPEAATEMYDLWLEYESASTPEACLVKDLDKFEMLVQAFEYEQREQRSLSQFFESTLGKFRHPEVIAWVQELVQRREPILAAMSAASRG